MYNGIAVPYHSRPHVCNHIHATLGGSWSWCVQCHTISCQESIPGLSLGFAIRMTSQFYGAASGRDTLMELCWNKSPPMCWWFPATPSRQRLLGDLSPSSLLVNRTSVYSPHYSFRLEDQASWLHSGLPTDSADWSSARALVIGMACSWWWYSSPT